MAHPAAPAAPPHARNWYQRIPLPARIIAALLRKGADKARVVASATLDRAYAAVGLLRA